MARTGNGGLIRMRARFYRASAQNDIGDELSDYAISGDISANSDAMIPMTLQATIRADADLTGYADCVAVFLSLTEADGTEVSRQMGLFVVMPPAVQSFEGCSYANLKGYDLTWLLRNSAVTDTYVVDDGTGLVAAAQACAAEIGLTRWSVPPSTETAAANLSWPPGTYRIRIINDLMRAAGHYAVWTDHVGQLVSGPYCELATCGAERTYASGPGSRVIGAVSYDPTERDIANSVTVVVDDPTRAPITVTLVNDNPDSATSTVRLGSAEHPRVISYVHRDPSLPNTAKARATARRILEERSSLYVRLDMTTLPEVDRELHEVYALDIVNDEGTRVAEGRWYCRGWDLSLVPSTTPLVHHLGKIENTEGVSE